MLRKKFPKGYMLAIDWSSAYNRTLRKAIFERLERDKGTLSVEKTGGKM